MSKNYIIDGSFQMLRTNPLLTTNLQIVVGSDYSIYLESINSHKYLSDDIYKHYRISKESFLEDKIAEFYKELPINIAYSVKDLDDEDIVYNEYKQQFDTLYWSGVGKVKENKFYTEEFEYFAPLYVYNNDLPSNFVILRVDDPAVYELQENDKVISNTTKENFREEIINKWKCVSMFDMTNKNDFGYWLENNYTSNDRFPKAPFEFDMKEYNYSRWYGIDYFTGVYTNKSSYMVDKLWYENPHFRLEKFITESFKNNELIYPNIANFKFLFDDNPASPFEYKKYSLNRYMGFYVDVEEVKTITPYQSTPLVDDLKIKNNIFMLNSQVTGSTMPFDIKTWNSDKNYYIYAINDLCKVERILDNGIYYYKIISDSDLVITDITRDNEVDLIFNDLGNKEYSNYIRPRIDFSFFVDRLIDDNGVEELYADLYLIKIDGYFHVLEKEINEYDGLIEHYIRSDFGFECDNEKLTYWLQDKTTGEDVFVEDINEKPIIFKIYKVKFRDVKDFDFNRINTGYADYDFNNDEEYVFTQEEKLYTIEHRDATDGTVFKAYDKDDVNGDKIINVTSEYISTDELFEINKNGLTDIWRKNQCDVKWGYKNSISHSDYPYKLNNSISVGSVYNRTSDVFSAASNELSKTHDYFYRVGDFYESSVNSTSEISTINKYYNNQTLSIQTETLETNYFDLDKYLGGEFDYFDYFFNNTRYRDEFGEYEQTQHYSIFNDGDNYVPSNTLFKGIKYNAYKLDTIIRDDTTDLVKSLIVDKYKNYNGYKFSVILNSRYTEISGTTVGEYELLDDIPSNSVYTTSDYFDENGLHVFINDNFKNILIIIDVKFTAADPRILTLNNTTYFEERGGLYTNRLKYSGGTSISYNEDAYTDYDPSVLTAYNFISSINSPNNSQLFDQFVTYYYIDEYNELGITKINGDGRSDTEHVLRDMRLWGKDNPPINLECEVPSNMKIKKNSYKVAAIKGPKYNIYDKYKTDYNELIYEKSFIKEPLSRYIKIDEKELKPKSTYQKELVYENDIYRFNGQFEPIFKTVDLFSPTTYNVINGGNFVQSKCGGFLNEIDNTSNANVTNVQLNEAIGSINNDISKDNKIVSYIDERLEYVGGELLKIKNLLDQDIVIKLNVENTYYENLKSITETSISSSLLQLTSLQNILPQQQIDTTSSAYWIFNDRSLGLCDGNYTSCEIQLDYLDNNRISNMLQLSDYDFVIPLDANINGISVNIKRRAKILTGGVNPPSIITDNSFYLIKPDGTESHNYANIPGSVFKDEIVVDYPDTIWSSSVETYTYGGETDLWGFSGITPQEINNTDFGVKFDVQAYKSDGQPELINIAYVDCVCITVHYDIDGITTGFTYISNIDRNVKFDTGLYEFGKVDELIFSKINENENPLKIKNTEEDRSIYPMVDEFGLQWDKRFIFKSSWDNDYYTRTKNEIE